MVWSDHVRRGNGAHMGIGGQGKPQVRVHSSEEHLRGKISSPLLRRWVLRLAHALQSGRDLREKSAAIRGELMTGLFGLVSLVHLVLSLLHRDLPHQHVELALAWGLLHVLSKWSDK